MDSLPFSPFVVGIPGYFDPVPCNWKRPPLDKAEAEMRSSVNRRILGKWAKLAHEILDPGQVRNGFYCNGRYMVCVTPTAVAPSGTVFHAGQWLDCLNNVTGTDLAELLAYTNGLSYAEAVRSLARHLDHDAGSASRSSGWTQERHPLRFGILPTPLLYGGTATYRSEDGFPMMSTNNIRCPNGDVVSLFETIWRDKRTGKVVVLETAPERPLPLYHADWLAADSSYLALIERDEAMAAACTGFSGVVIRGVTATDEVPLLLRDASGVVAVSCLPFTHEFAARECFGDEALQTPQDVLNAQVDSARSRIPNDARWVVVAHAFVAGASGSESERPLRIGGVETVSPETFAGAHYVALGHLHRPQQAGAPHIRYSGSPLAFGFDEANQTKSMSLVDISADDGARIEQIPFVPRRGVRVLRGKHAELVAMEPSTDFIKAVLTDDNPVIDSMKRLREVFPNACSLVYDRDERAANLRSIETRDIKAREPLDVFQDFVETVGSAPMTADEQQIAMAQLAATSRQEHAE